MSTSEKTLRLPTDAAVPDITATARAFLAHLADLQEVLGQLANTATEKLAALRRADAAALQTLTVTETELLQTLFHTAQERGAVLARLAQALQCPDLSNVRLGEIADRLPEPHASALRARSTALRAMTDELQRKNRIAGQVAQNLQQHIHSVFEALRGADQSTVGYGPQGKPETTSGERWVNAVG